MGIYFESIMGNSPTSFINQFNKAWGNKLNETLGNSFSSSSQLMEGSRLRPILFAWGFWLNSVITDKNISTAELNIALSNSIGIEMIHKASVIIDDLIDHDILRKGKTTFHKEFGQDVATIVSLSLISDGFRSAYIAGSTKNDYYGIQYLTESFQKMTQGALDEIKLKGYDFFDKNKIMNIMDNETVSLIENSFLYGFETAQSNSLDEERDNLATIKKIKPLVEKIGHKSGQLFQLLNDMEPFSNQMKNINYKGKVNFDFNVSRKNYVMAYTFGQCSEKEKKILISLEGSSSDESVKSTLKIINKHHILEKVTTLATELETFLSKDLNMLQAQIKNEMFNDDLERIFKLMLLQSHEKLS